MFQPGRFIAVIIVLKVWTLSSSSDNYLYGQPSFMFFFQTICFCQDLFDNSAPNETQDKNIKNSREKIISSLLVDYKTTLHVFYLRYPKEPKKKNEHCEWKTGRVKNRIAAKIIISIKQHLPHFFRYGIHNLQRVSWNF